MSLYEFNAASGGYLKAHGGEDESAISEQEASQLYAMLDRAPTVRH